MASSSMEQTFDIDTSVVSVEQQVKGNKMPFGVALTGGVDKYTGTQVMGDVFFDWKKNIGPKAQALIGQQTVSARVRVKFVPRNDGSGFFENKELLDIAPLGGLPAMAMPVAGGTPVQPVQQQPVQPQPMQAVPTPQPAPVASAPESAPAAVNPVGELMARQDAIEASRTRQGAVRAACEYVAAQAQAGMFEGSSDCDQALRARIKDLTAYVVTGSFPDDPVTPEEIAEEVAGVTVGAPVGVPFDTAEEKEAS